jgi:spermidine synthase
MHYQNSIYGNVTVTRSGEQYTFFSDGIPTITTPTPNISFVEEFTHLPLLHHPYPKDVLIISGGAGGVIFEILKHPSIERIDYTEVDPLILKVVKKFPTPLTESELSDERVNIRYTDGRFFMKKTSHKYDLVFVGISNPSDLQLNRFFTKEFFSLVKKRLREEGILVVSLPGSLTYLSRELKDINSCILNTLKNTYPYIRIIPGDGANLFLASSSSEISFIESHQLIERLNERALKTTLLTPPHIEYRLHPRWLNWFLESLKDGTKETNKDFEPLGVFYSLSYWNSIFSPYTQGLFRTFERINLRFFLILSILITLVFLIIHSTKRNLSIPLCILSTGFAGMIFDLTLIFSFQALYGYVFHWISLLVTAFMAGVVMGSTLVTKYLGKIKRELTLFLEMEIGIIIFSVILPIIFLSLHSDFLLLESTFLILSIVSGCLVGAQFPLANKIYLKGSNLSGTAGLLYGADLLGGWIGGLIGGVVLLPVLGLIETCMVVLMLKVATLVVLISTSKVKK